MIAGTEEVLFICIPDGKCKVTEKVIDTGLSPAMIGIQDEGTVRYYTLLPDSDRDPDIRSSRLSILASAVMVIIPSSLDSGRCSWRDSGVVRSMQWPRADRPCLPGITSIRSTMGKNIGHLQNRANYPEVFR